MGLSCSCPEWDGDPDSWCWFEANDFEKFNAKKRKRCCSCKNLVDINTDVLKFYRMRSAKTEIEERICGGEIWLAPLIMCEQCGEIYLNLQAIGYCLTPTDDMRECLSEYHELTGFKRKED